MPSILEMVGPRLCVRQPDPPLCPSGDSGACVLAGLLYLSIGQVYQDLIGSVRPLYRADLIAALVQAERDDLIDRLITATPHWSVPEDQQNYGLPSWQQEEDWFNYLIACLDGGYYGITGYSGRERGPERGPSSWALISGLRRLERPQSRRGPKLPAVQRQLLVSTANREMLDGQWFDAGTFLTRRGGFNSIFCRPT